MCFLLQVVQLDIISGKLFRPFQNLGLAGIRGCPVGRGHIKLGKIHGCVVCERVGSILGKILWLLAFIGHTGQTKVLIGCVTDVVFSAFRGAAVIAEASVLCQHAGRRKEACQKCEACNGRNEFLF